MNYSFNEISSAELMQQLAERLRARRLEKGLSRQTLAQMSGVPAPTIARFEQQYAISLRQYIDFQSPQQVEQMYRRMVYNVLIENKDDHAKNFTFICGKQIINEIREIIQSENIC